ncbi:PAS domain S-box protein [Desulfofustis limnaeus]|uniref:histidine kinase n=1 Tax=Desulfofustis limnaeus TaxID=2740163 RepID=A0ABM7WBR3_9BACT|nr:PAS domain S-box protein [Desulfofustis limnaeus]BDD88377.1 hypothetical protein DPPLL_27420 [Desulfofustis limnaeus]
MHNTVFLALINNAALLVSLGLLYEITGFRLKDADSIPKQLLTGCVLGGIGIAIMLNPWSFGQGIQFDTRSVLLCITGLFFGTIPVLLAMLIIGTFRAFLDGSGLATGIAVIITSGFIGLAWRHLRWRKGTTPSFGELYLLGLIVHLTMLACMVLLPRKTVIDVLHHITVPVLLIHPLATALLGGLMNRRRADRLAELALQRSEEKFRNIFQHHAAAKLLIDPETGQIVEANAAAERLYGWPVATLKTMNIKDINILSADQVADEMTKAKEGSRIYFEFRHRTAPGPCKDVEVYSSTVTIDGRTYLHSIIHDITIRKNQEKQIAALGEMLDAAPVAVLLHDQAGRLLFANMAASAMHGYDSRDAFMQKNLRDFMVPEMRDMFSQRIARITETRELRFDTTHVRRDGGRIPIDAIVRLIDWEGQPAFLAITIDVSERQRAQEAIASSNELLRYIVEHANSAIAVHDRELRYVYVSKNYLQQYHVTESEVIGRHHYDVFPDLPQKWRDVHQRALRGEVSGSERDAYPRADGSVEWTRWSCRPWYGADGAIGGLIVYTEVITDRVRAEEALRQHEEYLRAMISAAPMAIVSTDAQGNVQSWNTAAERIFGWHEEDMLGQPLPFFTAEQQEEFLRLRERVLAGETLAKLDLTRIRKDGSPVEISLSVAPMYDGGGTVNGLLAMIEDITSHKRTEQERDSLQVQLIQAQKMESIGRLAGGVAHDYNNMLGVILGYTEMALEKLYEDDPLHKDLAEIQKAAERSADITRQLLAFSRQQTIAPTVLDLNQAITNLRGMIRRLIGENIELIWQLGDELWPVFMDPTQIDQILINLLVNARDAITDVGTISIETHITTIDDEYCQTHYGFAPGDFVTLSITDNGCGMDRATREKLFEPFFTTKMRGKGTGLGLATVYGILQQNNCFINVYSEPGQGSMFTIYLPRYRQDNDATELQPILPHSRRRGRETILLLEDEEAILTMTALMLKGLGYTVVSCNTPNEALDRAAHQHIDLLITDVVMPEMNGRQVAERLQHQHPHLKTLFMSGYTANVIAHRGVLDKGVSFIQKPFSTNKLATMIREVLNA